jgi:hypothetical protein
MSGTLRLLAAVLVASSGAAWAADLVVIQGVDPQGERFYGGTGWTELSAELDARFSSVTVLQDATDLSALLAADRLWLDQRWIDGELTQPELTNLAAFLATGRRAVLVGEHTGSWLDWNNQILSLVGGTCAGDAFGLVHDLDSDPVLCFGDIEIDLPNGGVASGGTRLFDQSWATLWGNVVTVLDIGGFGDWTAGSSQFGRNLADWLLGGPSPGSICYGDGGGLSCGCGNECGPEEGGCLNGLWVPGWLAASGIPDTAADTLRFTCGGVTSAPGLLFQGDEAVAGGMGAHFGDGLRCCGTNVVRVEVLDPPGPTEPTTVISSVTVSEAGPPGTVTPGDTKCYQYWYRDPDASPCGSFFNLSNAVLVTWL